MSELMGVGLLVALGASLILARLAVVERRLARLSRLEAKVDALLEAAGVRFDAMRDVPPAVREAIESGQTILAIRRFREVTGTGLKEAKDFIDEVKRRRRPA